MEGTLVTQTHGGRASPTFTSESLSNKQRHNTERLTQDLTKASAQTKAELSQELNHTMREGCRSQARSKRTAEGPELLCLPGSRVLAMLLMGGWVTAMTAVIRERMQSIQAG